LALIARHGAQWFRSAAHPGLPGTTLVTVAGAVGRAGVYEIAGGTTVGELLQDARPSADLGAVLLGGYFGTWHPVEEVRLLPFTRSGLQPVGAAPGAAVLFALPAASCGLTEAARILAFLADQGAQQCGPCMFGLPAIAGDLAQLADARPEGDPLDRMQRRFQQIAGRGACRHPDGAIRMAKSALVAFAADAHAHARKRPCQAAPRHGRPSAALPAGQRQPGWERT
jgi:NADH:ubiquinone oxidoreductase subunit F (NADH-binding)